MQFVRFEVKCIQVQLFIKSLLDQGQLADIECVEAASGTNTGADVGLSCDVRFGFRCTNSAQERGSCLDYKIRYYCTCGKLPNAEFL